LDAGRAVPVPIPAGGARWSGGRLHRPAGPRRAESRGCELATFVL